MKRIWHFVIFGIALVGLALSRFVDEYVPIYEFPLGEMLNKMHVWVIDRGFQVGP